MQLLINKIAESYNPAYGQSKSVRTSGSSIVSRLAEKFFTPLLAPLLLNRLLNCIFVAFGVGQLFLVYLGLEGWQCPVYATTGVICPGCGMTTAMTYLLQGQWQIAFQTHAFAPLIPIALMMMLVAIALPASQLKKVSLRIKRLEQKTGITVIVLIGMLVYWLLRISDFI